MARATGMLNTESRGRMFRDFVPISHRDNRERPHPHIKSLRTVSEFCEFKYFSVDSVAVTTNKPTTIRSVHSLWDCSSQRISAEHLVPWHICFHKVAVTWVPNHLQCGLRDRISGDSGAVRPVLSADHVWTCLSELTWNEQDDLCFTWSKVQVNFFWQFQDQHEGQKLDSQRKWGRFR